MTSQDPSDIDAPNTHRALEYLRRAYASTREWYTISETKAQLLLAANGAFITVVYSSILGQMDDVRAVTATFGPETWVFLILCIAAIVAGVSCAALSMWSLHGRATKSRLDSIRVERTDTSYPPVVLWYFGDLARLNGDVAVKTLRNADDEFEVQVLAYHLVELSRRVLRKYRYVNAGWAFTAFALVMVTLTGVSTAIRL